MLTVKLNIADDLTKAGIRLKDIRKKVLPKSIKRATGRSVKAMQTEVVKMARKHRPLKAREVKKDWLRIVRNQRRRKVADISAELWIADKPISAIRLLKGSKLPRSQKGKKAGKNRKYKGRRRLNIMKHPGQKADTEGQFIAKGKGGNYHVFRRMKGTQSRGRGRGRTNPAMKKSAFPSLHHYFSEARIRRRVQQFTGKRLQREFLDAVNFFMKGAA